MLIMSGRFNLQLQRDNYDFFPLNRALVLDDEGDEVESKLDSLQQSIGKILQRQEELVSSGVFQN